MLIRQLASVVTLPVAVLVILPAALVCLFSYVPFWGIPYLAAMFLLVAGLVLTGLGFILLYSTISLFIKKGNGTIAPWDPPKRLIVTGVYAHVRNPMHVGVFFILAGESILIGSVAVALWTLLFILGNLFYVPMVEEQKLAKRFRDEYLIYKQNVPRWIPRLSSWKPRAEPLDAHVVSVHNS